MGANVDRSEAKRRNGSMNIVQKVALKVLNASGMAASINEAIYKWIGMNMPIWMKYNVEQYISEGYEKNADVYSVVNKIAGTASYVPWRLYKVATDGTKEEITEHPILDTWAKPNPSQGGFEFREELFTFYFMTGNGYINGVGPRGGEDKGKWQEFYIMPSQYTEVIFGGWKQPIKGYKINWDQEIFAPVEEVFHMKTPNLDYRNGQSLYGMSPISAAARAVTSSNAGYEAKVRDYQNGGLKGFLSSASSNPEPLGMSHTQLKNIREKLKEAGRKREIPATDFPLKYNQVGMSVVDMAILDSMQADLRTICNIYGISSILFNDPSSSTYNNVAEAKKSLYTDVIQPVLKKFQDELNRWWVKKYGEDLLFEPDYSDIEVLQENMKEKADSLKGVPVTVDEFREAMGFDRIGGPTGEMILMPANMMPIETLIGEVETTLTDEEMKQLGLMEYGNLKVHAKMG